MIKAGGFSGMINQSNTYREKRVRYKNLRRFATYLRNVTTFKYRMRLLKCTFRERVLIITYYPTIWRCGWVQMMEDMLTRHKSRSYKPISMFKIISIRQGGSIVNNILNKRNKLKKIKA